MLASTSSSFYIVLNKDIKDFKGVIAVDFDKPYRLRGDWEVGIVVCSLENEEQTSDNTVWIFCDLVDYTYVNNVPMQVVDIVDSKIRRNVKPVYVKVIKKSFASINVYFKSDPAKEELLSKRTVTCILHFRKS